MPSEPTLFAVFGPDGKRRTEPCKSKHEAWKKHVGGGPGWYARAARERDRGYTCREVKIVTVGEVAK